MSFTTAGDELVATDGEGIQGWRALVFLHDELNIVLSSISPSCLVSNT